MSFSDPQDFLIMSGKPLLFKPVSIPSANLITSSLKKNYLAKGEKELFRFEGEFNNVSAQFVSVLTPNYIQALYQCFLPASSAKRIGLLSLVLIPIAPPPCPDGTQML